MSLEKLTKKYTNCEGNVDVARLYGLSDLHYRTPEGEFKSKHALEIVSFVNNSFDSARGDVVLMERVERGSRFQGAIDVYPFADYVRGEGWDNMEMVRATRPVILERVEISNRIRAARAADDIPVLERAIADWDRVHPIFIDKSIIQRNIHCLAPAIKDTLSGMQDRGQTSAKLYVVAGMAHFTEDPALYTAFQDVPYIIYIDKNAPYLVRRQPQPPQSSPRRRR